MLSNNGRSLLQKPREAIGQSAHTSGWGDDILYGDAGIERFMLRGGDGADTIYFYQDGTDKFQLDGLTFGDSLGQVIAVDAFFGFNRTSRGI